MLSNKRGQITVFIILGIVILISFGVFFYLRSGAERPQPRPMPVRTYEPNKVTQFIEKCIDDKSREALDLIGANGGYITFPSTIDNNPFSYLSVSPSKELKNPYWYYRGRNQTPTLDSMSKDISMYVESSLKSCLNNFEGFEDFEITEKGDLSTDTLLAEEDVLVTVKYPIEIKDKTDQRKQDITQFQIAVPVRLKKAYDLARELTDWENRDMFVEDTTMDLIYLDEQIPDTGIEFTCKRKTWYVPEVKDRLKLLLRANLPYIKIAGTNYTPFPEGMEYMKNHYMWNFTQEKYENMHVGFTYDEKWPLELYTRPKKGQRMMSNLDKSTKMLSFLCTQIWHFTYDMRYPVKVTISDDETSEHERYAFTLAFEVSIDHNQGKREGFSISTFPSSGMGETESSDYCGNVEKEITINTINNITGEEIDDVNITFACGEFSCDMGSTEWLSNGAIAGLQKKFPYCTPGVVRATKEGYIDQEQFVSTAREKTVTVGMGPLKLMEYKVIKHVNGGAGKELEPGEKALVYLDEPGGYTTFAEYPKPEEKTKLSLLKDVDATYELSIFLTDENGAMEGGYFTNWTVSSYRLNGVGLVEFHVYEKDPKPSTPEQESDLYETISQDQNIITTMAPVLKEGEQNEEEETP